ncbi:MAG TPA: GNAT family N-acetyltransferase [Gemmata sp.]
MRPLDVSPAKPHELLPACRLLFGAAGAAGSRERLLSVGAESGLFVARAGGRLCAAALAQALPGALGVTCPPRGDSPEAGDAVVRAACEWLRARGVKVCQAFADGDEVAHMGPLERAGFLRTTELAFLRRDVTPDAPAPPGPGARLNFSAESAPFADEFLAALLATHDGSLDCPELNATREPRELLDGFVYPAFGWWFSARCDGEPVGLFSCAVGAEDAGAADLTYIGVVPSARGRGVGAELLGFALVSAARAGAKRVSVSVDVRNEPAVRLYSRAGFTEYERRGVWLAAWPTGERATSPVV